MDLIHEHRPLERGIFCNRTLNLMAIKAIGFDMDYTLIHYRTDEWERRAYEHIQRKLVAEGWPVADLLFDPKAMVRGLILDLERGNILKCNRFGYAKRAAHGTRILTYEETRSTYSRTVVDLAEPRFEFLNTLFSISEAAIYAQLVDLLDAGGLPPGLGYAALYQKVRRCLDEAHMEGELKAEIVGNPEKYVELDPDLPMALLDMVDAGKRLLLITNSEWEYTQPMMAYAFDRFLPSGLTWRDLFEVTILSARKPAFFSSRMPLFELVEESSLYRPTVAGLKAQGIFLGGDASHVERYLKLSGEEILYVGDHVFVDVHMSKNVLRWRTALVLHELEAELVAIDQFSAQRCQLESLMRRKQDLEVVLNRTKVLISRRQHGRPGTTEDPLDVLHAQASELKAKIRQLDAEIGPLAKANDELGNERWGPLMRAGNDKSHLARQVERYADIYMGRVSNFMTLTPYAYVRSPRGSLPHDT